MTDDCIVCLGGLRVATEVNGSASSLRNDEDAADATPLPPTAPASAITTNESKAAEDDEIIAHLLPCGHNMHDSCLRPWVERANSCPICRAQFNSVELRKYLNTPAYSSYVVQDKQQQAELELPVLDEDDFPEDDEPCVVCGTINNDYEVMYCDGCDGTVHVFCAGFTQSPEVWYCETCVSMLDHTSHRTIPAASRHGVSTSRRPGGQPRAARRRGRRGASDWDRVWQQVWSRLNLDLDFPYDDDDVVEPRRARTQRQEQAWQQRLQVANRHGSGNRFRDTASTLLQHQNPPPESKEEIQAWNAFDKARNFDGEDRPLTRRKRKSITTSPASPRDSDVAPERKLKRPRTRRNQIAAMAGPSTARPVQPAVEQPSFLTSLLQEVEKQPAPSEQRSSVDDENSGDEQQSPYVLSPISSPPHSGQVSPRALSVTPPPQTHPRPTSPMPLTSIVRPRPSSPPFSPFSPVASGTERERKRARPATQPSSPVQPASPGSPGRNMSYSTKTEIQRMVKTVLGPRYRSDEINKDQYTDINRDVSRLMYEKIGGAEGLADQQEREKWQKFANDEVERAVEVIRAGQQHDEAVSGKGSPT